MTTRKRRVVCPTSLAATHYAGALRWTKPNGTVVSILPGWAGCCSGDRARKVRESGNRTYDRARVNCKACLRNIACDELQTRADTMLGPVVP